MMTNTSELEQRFLDGDQFSTIEIAKEFFPELETDVARSKVYGMMQVVRQRLASDGLTLCQTGPGIFGIPQNKDQVEYGMDSYRRNIERNVGFAMMLYAYGKKKDILPKGMRNKQIMLPTYVRK